MCHKNSKTIIEFHNFSHWKTKRLSHWTFIFLALLPVVSLLIVSRYPEVTRVVDRVQSAGAPQIKPMILNFNPLVSTSQPNNEMLLKMLHCQRFLRITKIITLNFWSIHFLFLKCHVTDFTDFGRLLFYSLSRRYMWVPCGNLAGDLLRYQSQICPTHRRPQYFLDVTLKCVNILYVFF